MARTLFAILAAYCICTDSTIDRNAYSNYRGNAQHDGYLKFNGDTFSNPLKLAHNKTDFDCKFSTIGPSHQFISGIYTTSTYFCITDQNALVSIDPMTAKLNWRNDILNRSNISGMEYTNNYIGVVNSYNNYNYNQLPYFYIFNSIGGALEQNISITNLTAQFISTAVTAYDGLFYVFYAAYTNKTNNKNIGGLFEIDPKQGVLRSIDVIFPIDPFYPPASVPYAIPPTICNNGETIILSAEWLYLLAYDRTTFKRVWYDNGAIPIFGMVPICLQDTNQLLCPLVNSLFVYDIDTGNKQIPQQFASRSNYIYNLPIDVDRKLLIFDDGNELCAYDISHQIARLWDTVWCIESLGSSTAIIVGDSLILNWFDFETYHMGIAAIDTCSGDKLWETELIKDFYSPEGYQFYFVPGVFFWR